MAMKFIRDSVATAFASNVLEQPGGPYNRTPRGRETLSSLNIYKIKEQQTGGKRHK